MGVIYHFNSSLETEVLKRAEKGEEQNEILIDGDPNSDNLFP